MRLLLVRHGEPDYEKDCLTDFGHVQAGIVAKRLMEEGITEIFSSPLGRARETAEHFSEESGISDIKILDFMREIRFGPIDDLYNSGNPWFGVKDMIAEGLPVNVPDWRKNDLFKDNTATIDIDNIAVETDKWLDSLGFVREGEYYRCRGGEYKDRTIALFCHGGTMTAFISHVMNLPFPYMCAFLFHLDHTAINRLYFDGKDDRLFMPVMELASDAGHLRRADLKKYN